MREPVKRAKPIYVEVQDYLLDLINGPDYGPGDRIPSERVLADTLRINRMTVRKAIDKLVERNVLERNGTSGTRVPLVQVTRPIELSSSLGITRIIRNSGGSPGNKLLHFGEEAATESIARRLDLAAGADLIMFRRLRTVNDEPFCIETSYLPAERFAGLVAEDLVAGQSLYALLKARYGVEASARDREIGVGTATDMEARLLSLKPGSPTLVLRLVARDGGGTPIEYMKSVNHPHHVVFRNSTPTPQD
ncbi:GntR family transcriptional regulator [Bosea sp. 685]|uniref:GntR family transcriptional regulator n=1 Tax=Bosea sp. 685 TaxID=3080057 RepID=UPI002892D51F|nr:GntR family transcriptional regulator [Bosea sp. 685]WNJ90277.1 GntR family transcriptional regulator [Bosea sp. 685]